MTICYRCTGSDDILFEKKECVATKDVSKLFIIGTDEVLA